MFESLQPEGGGAPKPEGLVPTNFWILLGVTLIGAPGLWFALRPHPPVVAAGGPLMIALGTYFVVCSTFAPNFILYRLKVQRAIDWYGEDFAHVAYRVLGFGAIAGGIVFCLSTVMG